MKKFFDVITKHSYVKQKLVLMVSNHAAFQGKQWA